LGFAAQPTGLYAALTLAAATLAAPPENPSDPFGAMHRAFMTVAEALPGAGVRPQLMTLKAAPCRSPWP
jgi:hypothetical protein